jgi:hypothetical protein
MNERPVPARICGIEKEQYIRSASIIYRGHRGGGKFGGRVGKAKPLQAEVVVAENYGHQATRPFLKRSEQRWENPRWKRPLRQLGLERQL